MLVLPSPRLIKWQPWTFTSKNGTTSCGLHVHLSNDFISASTVNYFSTQEILRRGHTYEDRREYSRVSFGHKDELEQLSEAFNKLVEHQANYADDLKERLTSRLQLFVNNR